MACTRRLSYRRCQISTCTIRNRHTACTARAAITIQRNSISLRNKHCRYRTVCTQDMARSQTACATIIRSSGINSPCAQLITGCRRCLQCQHTSMSQCSRSSNLLILNTGRIGIFNRKRTIRSSTLSHCPRLHAVYLLGYRIERTVIVIICFTCISR